MRTINIILISLLVLLLTTCNEKKIVVKKNDTLINNNLNMVIINDTTEKNITQPKANVPDILTKVLPKSIPGTEKTPYKTGTIDDDNKVITVASSEYIFSNHGFLRFSITDYGNKKFIPDYEIRLFANPPIESGKQTEEFVINQGKGYVLWDDAVKEGSLYALINERFLLRIDGTRLPKKALKLQDYLKYFQINELNNLK